MNRIPEEQKRIAGFYWSAFKTVEGQKVLADLTARFYCGTPFSADSDRVTAFYCGQQDVIRYIDDMIKGARLPEENGDQSTYIGDEDDV